MTRRGFSMSDYDICKSYREAKTKSKQIGILADLNSVSRGQIKIVLMENGEMKSDARSRNYPIEQKVARDIETAKEKKGDKTMEEDNKTETVVKKRGRKKANDTAPEKQQKTSDKLTVSEIIYSVQDSVCKGYCKYHDLLDRPDNDEVYTKLLKDICTKCPLQMLG